MVRSKKSRGIGMTCCRCDGTGEIQFHFGNYDGNQAKLRNTYDGIENVLRHKTLTCPDCNGSGKEESE